MRAKALQTSRSEQEGQELLQAEQQQELKSTAPVGEGTAETSRMNLPQSPFPILLSHWRGGGREKSGVQSSPSKGRGRRKLALRFSFIFHYPTVL